MTAYDDKLYFIEHIIYRQHAIKIARRGDVIKLLIYPPDERFATKMVVEPLSNYETAIPMAKSAIDRMIHGLELAQVARKLKADAADRALRRTPRAT